MMRTIGITGGVGAGKSQILRYIEENYNCIVIRADEVAHVLREPGQACYQSLVDLLGNDVLEENGTIHRGRMAEKIFRDKDILEKVNQIIHPEVKKYIISQIAQERKAGRLDFFFVEAALLIEEHYDEILDEMWYVHTDEEIRKQRLMENRHYSEEKVAEIMRGQLSVEQFRRHCSVEIINNGNLEVTYDQINHIMGERV